MGNLEQEDCYHIWDMMLLYISLKVTFFCILDHSIDCVLQFRHLAAHTRWICSKQIYILFMVGGKHDLHNYIILIDIFLVTFL